MTYLLPCECGEVLSVETGQAGQQITCRCGRVVDVPTLRGLSQLRRQEERPAAASWSRTQGIVFLVGVLWLLVGGIVSGWLWSRALDTVRATAFDRRAQDLVERVETLTPAESLVLWRMYRDQPAEIMTGPQRIQEQEATYRGRRITAIAVTVVTVLGLGWFAVARRAPAQKQR